MRTSTLYHLLKGKRTSSVLSFGYFYDTLPYFALFPKIDEHSYNQTINYLMKNNFLEDKNEGMAVITADGINLTETTEFPNLNSLNQLSFYKWDNQYFERVLFTTQVLSEKVHQNNHYQPIETNLFKQQQLKRWLKKQKNDVSFNFYQEWTNLLQVLPKSAHELILGQLVGNEIRGATLTQLSEKFQQDVLFSYLEFKNYWHLLIQCILDDKENYPLFFSLLMDEVGLVKEDSYRQTSKLFYEGASIEKITEIRRLKASTVTDHLIEDYIVTQEETKIPNFSEEIKAKFDLLINQKSDFRQWRFNEAILFIPQLSFYEFKFFQFYLIKEEQINE